MLLPFESYSLFLKEDILFFVFVRYGVEKSIPGQKKNEKNDSLP